MQERPIRILVDALIKNEVRIFHYIKNEGFPPLKIKWYRGKWLVEIT